MFPSLRPWDLRLAFHLLYPRWANPDRVPKEGYAILLPVPSDLPFLYRLAINNIAQQNLENANEILVIPDIHTNGFRRTVQDTKPPFLSIPVRYCQDNPLRQIGARLSNSANFYHFTQLVCGINHANSQYALLHDADLLLTNRNFLESQFLEIQTKGLSALGIDRVWDSWYAENGYPHVTATWEMMFSVEWARSFRPILHRGHTNTVKGTRHKFDTTLLPQCLTSPCQIARRESNDEFIHFNYVISTYRHYLKMGTKFTDERFIIPLLRLLVDEFDPYGQYPALPPWPKISRMLQVGANFLPTDDGHNEKYLETRIKVERLLGFPLVNAKSATRIRERLAPFDERYRLSSHERHATPHVLGLAGDM